MASYHVARDGQEIGIFDEDVLQSKVADGSIRVTDLCWTSGMEKWIGVGQVLSTLGGGPPPVSSTPPPNEPVWSSPLSGTRPAMPQNHLVWAILTTILCCLPFGIVAIVYSCKVEPRYLAGEYASAQSAANTAKLWCWISFWCVLGPALIFLLILLVGGGSAAFIDGFDKGFEGG